MIGDKKVRNMRNMRNKNGIVRREKALNFGRVFLGRGWVPIDKLI